MSETMSYNPDAELQNSAIDAGVGDNKSELGGMDKTPQQRFVEEVEVYEAEVPEAQMDDELTQPELVEEIVEVEAEIPEYKAPPTAEGINNDMDDVLQGNTTPETNYEGDFSQRVA